MFDLENGGLLKGFSTKNLEVVHWGEDLEKTANLEALEDQITGLFTPGVLEYLPQELDLSDGAEAISEWAEEHGESSLMFIVQRKGSQDAMGLLQLRGNTDGNDEGGDEDPSWGQSRSVDAGPSDLQINFFIEEMSWGQGLGTELVKGVLDTLGQRGASKIRGIVHAANAAGARVFTKNGFSIVDSLSDDETEIYEI